MFQTRFHGRGGQGVVTAAEMLSVAAFQENKHAQAFPIFGSERMGAPVMSFCRISDHEIRSREPVAEPDALIIQDPTLLSSPDLFSGLVANGVVLINSSRALAELGVDKIIKKLPPGNVMTVPATELALEHVKKPLPNAAMLGALAALTGIIRMESVAAAINEILPTSASGANIAAAMAAFRAVTCRIKEERAC